MIETASIIRIVDQQRSDEVRSGGEGPSLSKKIHFNKYIYHNGTEDDTFDMETKDNWLVAFHKYHTT